MSRILVVEDHPANRKLVRDLLRREGHEVLEAVDGDRALQAARSEPLDLVVMDVQLPGTDGLTATRLLRADPATADLPVLALTAHAMTGDEERVLAAGCDRYLAKPLRYRRFLEVVDELLGGDAA